MQGLLQVSNHGRTTCLLFRESRILSRLRGIHSKGRTGAEPLCRGAGYFLRDSAVSNAIVLDISGSSFKTRRE